MWSLSHLGRAQPFSISYFRSSSWVSVHREELSWNPAPGDFPPWISMCFVIPASGSVCSSVNCHMLSLWRVGFMNLYITLLPIFYQMLSISSCWCTLSWLMLQKNSRNITLLNLLNFYLLIFFYQFFILGLQPMNSHIEKVTFSFSSTVAKLFF